MAAVALLARQRIREVREILKHDHVAALNELEDIFQDGVAPASLLDGRFSGQIITTTYQPSMNALVRFVINNVFSWKGSSFDIETATGNNLVAHNMSWLVKLMAGRGRCAQSESPKRFHAFEFETHFGTSLHYPDHEVLIADYCTDSNPAPLNRVVNEIVEIGDGYYLGRLLMRQHPCRWLCRAFFTLSELPEVVTPSWLEQVA
jgi:hypothetical protein